MARDTFANTRVKALVSWEAWLVAGLLAGNGHIYASSSVKVEIKSHGQDCNEKEMTGDGGVC